jgi:hypothetical protein
MEKLIIAVIVLPLLVFIPNTIDLIYRDAPSSTFTSEKMSQQRNEQIFQLEKYESAFPVKLFPVVDVRQKKITTDFYVVDGQAVSVPGSREVFLEPVAFVRMILITMFWILIPSIGIFSLALLVFRKSSGKDLFWIFSILSCVAVLLSFVTGAYFGPGAGLATGIIFAIGITAYTEKLAALFTVFFASGYVGYYAGSIASAGVETGVLYRYIILYIFICLLALVARYFLTPSKPAGTLHPTF